MRRITSWNIGTASHAGTNSEKNGVIFACLHLFGKILNLAVKLNLYAKRGDAGNFGIKHLARQAILRNAIAHRAARLRCSVNNMNGMPESS